MLAQHLKTGNIVRIRQGLYASIPSGANPQNYSVDPYAIISALAPDALVSYHTALQFYGLAYTLHFQHIFQSTEKIRDFTFREDRFKGTQYPKSLPKSQHMIFTEQIDHHGSLVHITSIERTLVDCLDRINLSGGLEEVWRSLNNKTTIAKLGFYLRLHQAAWNIEEKYFVQLKAHLPKSVHYLDRQNRTQGQYIKEWRIMMPSELIEERWNELLDTNDL
jgi:predicted transcriptional regulator of viral defense system